MRSSNKLKLATYKPVVSLIMLWLTTYIVLQVRNKFSGGQKRVWGVAGLKDNRASLVRQLELLGVQYITFK